MVESEDVNFRTHLLWSEIHGAGVGRPPGDLLDQAELQVSFVKGIVGTDSKRGFDAVTLQEGPYLGLSNGCASFPTKAILSTCWHSPRMAFTRLDAGRCNDQTVIRVPPRDDPVLETMFWMLSYDPHFVTSARKANHQG